MNKQIASFLLTGFCFSDIQYYTTYYRSPMGVEIMCHFHEKKRSALVRLIEMRDARLSRSNNPQKRLQRRNELVETFLRQYKLLHTLLPDKNAQFRAPSTSWHKFDFAWHLLLHFISLRAFAGYMSFDSFYRI